MKITILTMTSSLLLVLIASLIFSDGRISVAVANGYSIDRIAAGCSKTKDDTGELRMQALTSIDSAIHFVVSGLPNDCASATKSTVFAAANCSSALSADDCKLCLYNAQFRVVDAECPRLAGGWLALKDCYVRFDTNTAFCHHLSMS